MLQGAIDKYLDNFPEGYETKILTIFDRKKNKYRVIGVVYDEKGNKCGLHSGYYKIIQDKKDSNKNSIYLRCNYFKKEGEEIKIYRPAPSSYRIKNKDKDNLSLLKHLGESGRVIEMYTDILEKEQKT